MKRGWIKQLICAVLILAFVFQYSATALASFLGVEDEILTVYDENGNPVQSATLEEWEAQYPYGMFAFKETQINLKENAVDGTETGKLTIYRIGGTSGRADVQVTLYPAISRIDDTTVSYANAAGKHDYTVKAEGPWDIAEYQPYGDELGYLRGDVHVESDDGGVTYYLTRGEYSEDPYADFACIPAEDVTNVQWQIRFFSDEYATEWEDIAGATGECLDLFDDSWTELLDELLNTGAEWDFRCSYEVEGQKYYTYSWYDEEYDPKSALEYTIPEGFVNDQSYYTYDIIMDGEEFDAYSFDVIFADGEWEKEIIFTAVGDSLHEVGEVVSVALTDSRGADINRSACTASVAIEDDEPELPSHMGFEDTEVWVDKSAGTVRIPLTRISEGLQYVTGVDFETRDGTALMGRDYAKAEGTAIFLSDLNYTYIELDLINDMVVLDKEDSELYFTIVLTAAKGGGKDSTLIEDKKELVVRLYNTATESENPNLATEIYSPDEDDLTGSITDTGAVVPGGSTIIARAEEEKEEIELYYGFTVVPNSNVGTYEYIYPGVLSVGNLVGASGYWKNRAALAGYPGSSDNEQGWRSDQSKWQFTNTDKGEKHCGSYGSGWYSTSQRKNELKTSIDPNISGYNAQDVFTEWYWEANSYADYNGKDWTDIRPALYFGTTPLTMTDSPIAQKDKYSKDSPAYGSGTIPIENLTIGETTVVVTGVGFYGNYRTGGVLDYDAQNSIRLITSYLTRRTLKAPKIRIFTADDDRIEASTENKSLLDTIKPKITMVSGQGGAKDSNTIYAGSKVTVTRADTAAGYQFAVDSDGKLNKSVFYSTDDADEVFTWGAFASGGASANLTLVQDSDDYATQGYINVVMDRLQTINLNVAPSVPRLDGSTAIDTAKVDDAINDMWSKIGDKGISVKYRVADYIFEGGDDGYSKVKTLTITKSDLATVNGVNASSWSQNTVLKLGKKGNESTQVTTKDNKITGVMLRNVQSVNFNLPENDLIVYKGKSYAGNAWIEIDMGDFLNYDLMFYYYDEDYVKAINTMTLNIARIERYIDLNGDGTVSGTVDHLGRFVPAENEVAWNDQLSDTQNIANKATYYQLPILSDGAYSISELAPQLTPLTGEHGEQLYRQIVLKIYYGMMARCLVVPAGASENDRAEIIPAAVTTVTTPHLLEEMTDEQLGYRYLDHSGTGMDHLMYTAAATNNNVFVDVPLGGDVQPADILNDKVVWTPEWVGAPYNEADHYTGGKVPSNYQALAYATPMQFADPEAIYLNNTPVGDRYAVGLEKGREMFESGRVIVLWHDDHVYDEGDPGDPDDDKKGSYVEEYIKTELIDPASNELTPDGKLHVRNFLAALQENDTIALCVREYPALRTGETEGKRTEAPTALEGIESSCIAGFYTYPTSVGARQMTDPMNTGNGAETNPNKTQGFDSSEADTGMDEYNMDGRISMPELDMNLTSLVNIATSGQDIVITVGFSPLTVARETKVKKQDGTWTRPEVGSPASNTAEGVSGVTQLVNSFRGRGDSVQKEMRSFFKEMKKAKQNKPTNQAGIRAAGVNVDVAVSISMVLKWNPLENEFFFNQMMVAVAAGIEFSYTVRLTPCPVFYCTVTVGFSLEIAMGLEAARIKVKGGEWDLGEEMGKTFQSETGTLAGKWFEVRGQENLGSKDAEEPNEEDFVVGLPGASFSVKTVEKALDITFNGTLYVDAFVLNQNGERIDVNGDVVTDNTDPEDIKKPVGFSPGTIKGDGGDPVTIKLAEKVDGKDNEYQVMVTFTVIDDGEKRYFKEGNQTKQIRTYETDGQGNVLRDDKDQPIVECETGFCLVDRVVAIDKQTFDVFFTGVVISPELFLEFAVGVGCELFKVELFINITIGCSFSLYSHQSEDYAGEDDEDSAFAFNEFSFLAGIGFRVTALFFNFEFNAVQLAVTYDREAKFDETSQKNSGWNTIWYAANQPVKKYSLLDDEEGLPADPEELLGMNIVLPGALTHDETLYTIDDNLQESSTFAFDPTDKTIPFQYSGYGTSGDAFRLGEDLVSGSTYELVTVGGINYIVYTLTVSAIGDETLAGINQTRLVISKVQETIPVGSTKATYGLAHPFDAESTVAYAVLDQEFVTTQVAGQEPVKTATNYGDLDFDAWVDDQGNIRVAFVSYTADAAGAYDTAYQSVQNDPTKAAIVAMAAAGKHTVVKTVTVDLANDKIGAPVIVSDNQAGHGMYYLPSGATNAKGETMIFYAEALYHDATSNELDTLLALYKAYYGGLSEEDIKSASTGGTTTYYGEGDPSGGFQYQYKMMQLMTYGKSFYPTFAVLEPTKVEVTTSPPEGDPIVETTITESASITRVTAQDWIDKGVQIENATLTAIDDETSAFYVAYSTAQHQLIDPKTENGTDYSEERTFRKLYLQKVDVTLTPTVDSTTVPGTVTTTTDASVTANSAIAIRILIDDARNDKADGVYVAGSESVQHAYTDPYFANVQFLHGKLGAVTGVDESFGEAVAFAGEILPEHFLIFEMNGNTYIVSESNIKRITSEERKGSIIPFFTRETAEQLSAAAEANNDSEVKGAPAVTNVTFGVDGNGNIAAVYTQNVPNSPHNAVYLTKYDEASLTWGMGTMLAMRDMQTYEDSVANEWTAEESVQHFYDTNHNQKLDAEDAPQSFNFNKLSVGFAGQDRILVIAEGTLMQLEAVGAMMPVWEKVTQTPETGGGTGEPSTFETGTAAMAEYELSGITAGEGFSFSPAKTAVTATASAYDTQTDIFALSFGVGQRGIGMAAIHLSNYNLVSGASMDAYVSFVNTGDVSIRASEANPATIRLVVEADGEALPIELAKWTVTENIRAGQQAETMSAQITLPSMAPADEADRVNGTKYMKRGGKMYFIVSEDNEYIQEGAFSGTTLLLEGESNACLVMEARVEMGFESFGIEMIGEDGDHVILQASGIHVGNRGSKDSDKTYLHFQYTKVETDVEGNEYTVYSNIDLTGHALSVSEQEQLVTGYSLSDKTLQNGYLLLSTMKDGTTQNDDSPGQIKAGYGRTVNGTFRVPKKFFDTASGTGSLNLVVSVESYTASGGENSEYNVTNNEKQISIEQKTGIETVPGFHAQVGTTLRLPISMWTSRATAPSVTLTEMTDDGSRHIGILYYDINNGAIVAIPTGTGTGKIRVADPATHSFYDICYTIEGEGVGLNIFNDNLIFTWYDKNGRTVDTTTQSAAESGWGFQQALRFPGTLSSLDEVPLRSDLAKGENSTSFSFQTQATSIELFFMGENDKTARIEVSDSLNSFATKTFTSSDASKGVKIDFELNGLVTHTVTVKVKGGNGYSGVVYFDKMVETFAGDAHTKTDPTGPDIFWNRDKMPLTGTLKGAYQPVIEGEDGKPEYGTLEEGDSVPLTVYFTDLGGLAAVTVNGEIPTEDMLTKINDNLWIYEITLKENGHYRFVAMDTTGNTTTRDLTIDWFLSTKDATTVTMETPIFTVTVADDKKSVTVVPDGDWQKDAPALRITEIVLEQYTYDEATPPTAQLLQYVTELLPEDGESYITGDLVLSDANSLAGIYRVAVTLTKGEGNTAESVTGYVFFYVEDDAASDSSAPVVTLKSDFNGTSLVYTAQQGLTAKATNKIKSLKLIFTPKGGTAQTPEELLENGVTGTAFTGSIPLRGLGTYELIVTDESGKSASSSFTISTLRVHFNRNDETATGEMASLSVTDVGVALTDNVFEKEGHAFAGWNTKTDGSGEFYADGAEITLTNSDITLYAQWQILKYTITVQNLDNQNGSYEITEDFGTVLTEPTQAIEGWTFLGWTITEQEPLTPEGGAALMLLTAGEGGGEGVPAEVQYDTFPTAMPAKNLIAYANWQIITYPVHWYNYDRESMLDEENAAESLNVEALEIDGAVDHGAYASYEGLTPQKPATAQWTYVFKGWALRSDLEALLAQGELDLSADEERFHVPLVDIDTYEIKGPTEFVAQYAYILNDYDVTWENYDGTVLESDRDVSYGKTPEYDGETPQRAASAQWTYVFKGWALKSDIEDLIARGELDPLANEESFHVPLVDLDTYVITGPVTFVAQYAYILNDYDVTWENYDGTVLESDRDVNYGSTPYYNGEIPTKPSNSQYSYRFVGWDREITPVTGDETYRAVYSASTRTYSVIWKDENGRLLDSDLEAKYGTMPVYSGITPEKASDAQYSYTFIGWDKEITRVWGNAVYQAVYEKTLNTYTVTWLGADGAVLAVEENVPYGTVPVYKGETPVKTATQETVYTFKGWTEAPAAIVSDTVYTAEFEAEKRMYTVTFMVDGKMLDTYEIAYGEQLRLPAIPAKEGYTMTAPVWDMNGDIVTSDLTLHAVYTVNVYEVTYLADGKTVKTELVEHGKDATAPAIPEKIGYTETAPTWDKDGKNITSDTVITAKYVADPNVTTPDQDSSVVVIVIIVIIATLMVLGLVVFIIFYYKKKKKNEA